MEILTPFAQLAITGVNLAALIVAITQKAKRWFPDIDPEAVSTAAGAVLGVLSYLYVAGVPDGLNSAIAMAIYILGVAFMPSGAYEVAEEIAAKSR